ncbi:MAG: hypothetical protein OXC17_09095, partial [Aestuariivita sp.]|nr:hypothetical protein [Aestuariivita sp.]
FCRNFFPMTPIPLFLQAAQVIRNTQSEDNWRSIRQTNGDDVRIEKYILVANFCELGDRLPDRQISILLLHIARRRNRLLPSINPHI